MTPEALLAYFETNTNFVQAHTHTLSLSLSLSLTHTHTHTHTHTPLDSNLNKQLLLKKQKQKQHKNKQTNKNKLEKQLPGICPNPPNSFHQTSNPDRIICIQLSTTEPSPTCRLKDVAQPGHRWGQEECAWRRHWPVPHLSPAAAVPDWLPRHHTHHGCHEASC